MTEGGKIVKTNIWHETIGTYANKWVCQVFDKDYRCIVVSGESFQDVVNQIKEMEEKETK